MPNDCGLAKFVKIAKCPFCLRNLDISTFGLCSQTFVNESAFSLIYCPMSDVFSRCFQLFTHNSTIIAIPMFDLHQQCCCHEKKHFSRQILLSHNSVAILPSFSDSKLQYHHHHLSPITRPMIMQLGMSEKRNLDEAMKCRGVDYKHIRGFEDCLIVFVLLKIWLNCI